MSKLKLSVAIANLLASQGISQVFGIIGSANAHLFDAVYHHPQIQLTCLHHEQACVMAAHGYYMQSGQIAAVFVTAGAGITNALTGVVGAWADSVPVLILSGQEATKQFASNNLSRMIGIQGVYTESIYESCTKSVVTCKDSESVVIAIASAVRLAREGRPGPCIVDIPIDLQSNEMEINKINTLINENLVMKGSKSFGLSDQDLSHLLISLKSAKAPLLWLGNGLRKSSSAVISSIVRDLGIPYLTSWTATDLFDPIDDLYAGHAGTYGGRAGNLILQSCDVLLTLGTRLAIPQKGYVDHQLARRAKIFVIDCDQIELNKLSERFDNKYLADASAVLSQIHQSLGNTLLSSMNEWLSHVDLIRNEFSLVEPCHLKKDAVDSYQFISDLGNLSSSNTTFVTDMGTALISGFQVLEPKNGQRLFTSQGLGEMGYGLPGAIGAWFADPSRQVICLNCDGGLMMNLQDLHSVISHQIPLKLVIFNNDGYLMIKHTQNAIVGGRRAGTDRASGLTCPDYKPLVKALGFDYFSLSCHDQQDQVITEFLEYDGASVLEVFMDADQLLVPKLSVSVSADGTLVSPPLEDLSPLIPLEQIERLMLVDVHPNSISLERDEVVAKGDAIY